MTTRKNLVVACRDCNELNLRQLIPEELRPMRGETFPVWKRRKKTKRQQKASDRFRARISMIRLAAPMGIYLDDLFSKGELKQWK